MVCEPVVEDSHHWDEEPEPDPHQSEKLIAVETHNGTFDGLLADG